MLVPIPSGVVVVVASALLVALLISGSYKIVDNVFKPLTLALLAYIGSDALARPDWTTARWQDRAIDVGAGMVFSNIITYFVSLATAATLNAQGQTDVNSAADAARALEPLADSAATMLFAVGLIGAGALAVPF